MPRLTRRTILVAGGLLVLLAIVGVRALAARAPIPARLGVRDGKLAPCPPTPNCVSSQAADPAHRMEPISYGPGAGAGSTASLLVALVRAGGNRVVEQVPGCIRAEFTVPVLGFVDDVEFYFPPDAPVIHFRSASRLGRSDLGVNRRRMERLRELFTAPQRAP